jgi:hypothetical protein
MIARSVWTPSPLEPSEERSADLRRGIDSIERRRNELKRAAQLREDRGGRLAGGGEESV